MAEFPVAFIFFISDFDASEALCFCHDENYDILDVHRFGHNIIGFFKLAEFERCKLFCSNKSFHCVVYCIKEMYF